METTNLEDRLARLLELLKKEYLQAKLQREIAGQVEKQVMEHNRKAMLHEQLKVIKKELGITKDDKDAVAEKFQARLKGLTVPVEVSAVIDEEMNKLNFLDPNSSEFNVTRNYLDWLTALPWGKTTDENLDVDNAQMVMLLLRASCTHTRSHTHTQPHTHTHTHTARAHARD
jgi:Lon-like ATP-dependent protease